MIAALVSVASWWLSGCRSLRSFRHVAQHQFNKFAVLLVELSSPDSSVALPDAHHLQDLQLLLILCLLVPFVFGCGCGYGWAIWRNGRGLVHLREPVIQSDVRPPLRRSTSPSPATPSTPTTFAPPRQLRRSLTSPPSPAAARRGSAFPVGLLSPAR